MDTSVRTAARPFPAAEGARGLVDLHCHVLPGIDDGALDLTDSLAMVAQAAADGISIVCATPHISADHAFDLSTLACKVADLDAAVAAAGLPVRIVIGGEVAAPWLATLSDAELAAVSLGGSEAWILLEPGPGPMGAALERSVAALRERGFGSIIAHPERHAGADARCRLEALVARGALVQVTAALLVDHPAAPTMLDWAERGLVHFVGSDAHSSRIGRTATVSAGVDVLSGAGRLGPHIDWIARDGPRAILAGEPVTPPF